MSLIIPEADGEVNRYSLSESGISAPRIYFVNGIRVLGRDHAVTAALLSLLTERPIFGVYNRTAGLLSGLVFDFGQCLLDYAQNATARLSSQKNADRPPVRDADVNGLLEKVKRNSIVWNSATAKLFEELVLNRNTPQIIIAHSQSNLITSNALFILEDMLGANALRNIRVFSLASPAPAWPLGLRKINGGGGRQENAFMNDLIALLRPHNLAAKVGVGKYQNAGDFRTHSESFRVSLTPHDTKLNMALNFLKSIRMDLGLSPDVPPDFLASCAKKADAAFSTERSWLQRLNDIF